MAILSIQSSVAAGHVGNSAAVFPLQRLGFEVWRVDTVAFSNHPAYGRHTGRIAAAGEVAALLRGLEDIGLWGRCDGIQSGYLGSAETGGVTLDAVHRIRTVRREALYLCDPVIGDDGKIYVDPGIVEFYRQSGIPAADIVTPNAFEAAHLTGIATATVEGALSAARALSAAGPRIAVVTGIQANGRSQTVAVSAAAAWCVDTPRIHTPSYGAGDVFAALLFGHLLKGSALPDALSRGVSAVHGLLAWEPRQPGCDLPLVAAQESLLDPPRLFPAEPIS
jgi:pyridoxine kinase